MLIHQVSKGREESIRCDQAVRRSLANLHDLASVGSYLQSDLCSRCNLSIRFQELFKEGELRGKGFVRVERRPLATTMGVQLSVGRTRFEKSPERSSSMQTGDRRNLHRLGSVLQSCPVPERATAMNRHATDALLANSLTLYASRSFFIPRLHILKAVLLYSSRVLKVSVSIREPFPDTDCPKTGWMERRNLVLVDG